MGIERRVTDSAPTQYRPRRPSRSVLYRCVQEHLESWLAQCCDGHHDDGPVPPYVEREFRRYLDCGILAHGFARARCGQCGHDFLIAFSCKGRGVCPSCNTRRMVATAAHLTDHVLPPLPVRQWVLAVPKRLRYFLHRDADLQGAALRLFLRAVEQCLRAHSPGSGPAARLGAVAFIHRFGSTLNAHLHFHCVVIDGVFDAATTGGIIFTAATGVDANAIAQVQAQVRRRLLRVFVRRGLLPRDDARAMGQWAHGGGFSVDGSVRIEAADRAGRERLLRYCARPPFALDRLRELDPERLLYEGTKPGPGGGGPLLRTPLELIDRLAALWCRRRASTATATSPLRCARANGRSRDSSAATPNGRSWPERRRTRLILIQQASSSDTHARQRIVRRFRQAGGGVIQRNKPPRFRSRKARTRLFSRRPHCSSSRLACQAPPWSA
jgi:hypothetical protein